MHRLSAEQRPRERLLRPSRGLSEAEVLTCWGTGQIRMRWSGQELLTRTGGLSGLLQQGLQDWTSQHGVGPAKACQLWAAQELCRRSQRATVRPRINSPKAAGAYLMPRCQGYTEERFGLLALNAKGDLLAERILSQGTSTATLISPREFFREALRFGATTALAFHNHPSGDPSPSREDIQLTRRLRTAGGQAWLAPSDPRVRAFHNFRAAEG